MSPRSWLSAAWALLALAAASTDASMMGAFEAISDLDDGEVVKSAEFAVRTLFFPATASDDAAETAVPPYSFLSKTDGEEQEEKQQLLDQYSVDVVEGSRQVVAGMNYRITIALISSTDPSDCLGAFRATIYDHFGDMTVTTWGQEVSCDFAKDLVSEKQIDEAADAEHGQN